MGFPALGLDARITRTLAELGFTAPTTIQQQAIPAVLAGQNVMASAQTGTGKTAAFALPCLHHIIQGPAPTKAGKPAGRGPRVLVLTPTRELALQVLSNFRAPAKGVRVAAGAMVGGVAYGPQLTMLRSPLDVLVATPGRFIDHMQEGNIDFSRMEILVLDEADKMLDMGFLKPVERILAKIEASTARPQMLLFSATFTDAVESFAKRHLPHPTRIELAPKQTSHAHITQKVYRADSPAHKAQMLHHLLGNLNGERALVFCATKHGSDRLAGKLTDAGYRAEALHGGMKQNARKRTLDKLHKGDVQVLVATDVAARGIDVKELGHVINFDLPQVAEDYVHRIGRTGRAGAQGLAASLVAPEDYPMLKDIEKVLGSRVEYLTLPGLAPQLELHEFNRQGAAAPRSRQQKRPMGPRPAGQRPEGRMAAPRPTSSPRNPAPHTGGTRRPARRP